MTLPIHPYAKIFPLIEGQEFAEFVEDIRVHGLRDAIILLDDQVLDGRNRYNALTFLAESGELLGKGWSHRAGEPLDPEMLVPSSDNILFRAYSPADDGVDALDWVWSKNFRRRQLTKSQLALVLSDREQFRHGGVRQPAEQDAQVHLAPAKPSAERATRAELAEEGVSERYLAKAAVIRDQGTEDLRTAVRQGHLSVSAAEPIARLPEAEQPAALERALPSGHRAIMGSRLEPDDSLDYFPTPPWATRALIEHVFPPLGLFADLNRQMAWEPACGEGHIAEVLREYFGSVNASDIHDYGYGDAVQDFLHAGAVPPDADWIITNPPFGDRSEAFVLKALQLAGTGVAMFVRLQWLETVGRYETIFRDTPPTVIAFFAERVPLCKGRWNPEGDTATAYVWLVWIKNADPRAPFWIPPGCRTALTHADDITRFTANPVIAIPHRIESKQETAPDSNMDAPGCTAPSAGGAAHATAASPESDPLELPAFLKRRPDVRTHSEETNHEAA